MKKTIKQYMEGIPPLNKKAIEQLQAHHLQLLMPTGALAVPLTYVEKLAGIQGIVPVKELKKKRIVLFAADHGIAEEGVSAYPQEVTQQMLGSFANNWAVITALARKQQLDMIVVDLGVKGKAVVSKNIFTKKIAQGTNNFLHQNAMSQDELYQAFEIGLKLAEETKNLGYEVALLGEMGIGNTTSASAITASILNLPAAAVTGHGTGVTKQKYKEKIAIVEEVLKRRNSRSKGGFEILEKVGGFEIVGMCGFLLGAAYYRLPVILDGFITGAAALVTATLSPQSKNFWIAGHVSQEIGHQKILENLSLRPILDLDLRLGEASGAALALPVLEQAIAISRDTGTFNQAKVTDK